MATMNKYFFPILLTLPVLLSGQPGRTSHTATGDSTAKIYKLSGFRHGVSYFPGFRYCQVQYEPGDSLGFDVYHSADVLYHWLEKWAGQYPDIIDLYETGISYEGRPVMQITLTNKKKGKHTDKPAAFIEGGRHSGEVTGSECVMWLARHLIESYGKDPVITGIIDNKTIYLRPVNNPDGHNLYMHTAQSNRSTTRPVDNDNDGLLDEDPSDDLDGDGRILTMRWKDDIKGNMSFDPADSTGRMMKRVKAGEGKYMTSTEGIDNDGDGKINEDGIGGLDLHRNYPENWRPVSEETGRGFTQGGAGEYPLSETETRSVVEFLLRHPNISVVNSMDTSVPMHLRPPSTSPSAERMYPEDLEWYRKFDALGKSITGYKKAGDVYNDYGSGNPLFGHGPDFGYWYYGAIWYGDEIWNSARFRDYNNDGDTSQIDVLIWDEKENDGAGFIEWKPAKHPVYGDIEIGGFDLKFFSQNPPAAYLEEWIRNQALFNLEMIKHLPEVEWENIEVKKIKSYKTDSADYKLKINIRNTGKLPTALRQAQLVKIVREDRIEIEFDTTGTRSGKPGFRIIEDRKTDMRDRERFDDDNLREFKVSGTIPFIQGGTVSGTEFVIRLYNRQELKGKANFYSTRGGVLRDREFVIH
ncbi:MAG: peptidase [Bacteroidales bacterium]|nr:peptidase [Bacteroidales bacterium]